MWSINTCELQGQVQIWGSERAVSYDRWSLNAGDRFDCSLLLSYKPLRYRSQEQIALELWTTEIQITKAVCSWVINYWNTDHKSCLLLSYQLLKYRSQKLFALELSTTEIQITKAVCSYQRMCPSWIYIFIKHIIHGVHIIQIYCGITW